LFVGLLKPRARLDLFDDLVAPDYVDHTHQQQGREEFIQLFTLAFDAFPDWHEAIEDIIAEGDRVWFVLNVRGHIPASGIILEFNSPRQARR
jgi:predicted ester cyclase